MKLQLRDLLVKRNMEELHITAQHKVRGRRARDRGKNTCVLRLLVEACRGCCAACCLITDTPPADPGGGG